MCMHGCLVKLLAAFAAFLVARFAFAHSSVSSSACVRGGGRLGSPLCTCPSRCPEDKTRICATRYLACIDPASEIEPISVLIASYTIDLLRYAGTLRLEDVGTWEIEPFCLTVIKSSLDGSVAQAMICFRILSHLGLKLTYNLRKGKKKLRCEDKTGMNDQEARPLPMHLLIRVDSQSRSFMRIYIYI